MANITTTEDYTPPDNDDGVSQTNNTTSQGGNTTTQTSTTTEVYNSNNKLKTINIMAAATPVPGKLSSIKALDEGGKYKIFKGNSMVLVGELMEGTRDYTGGLTDLNYINWKTVGEVLADSTTYAGEDASSEDTKNEQGAVVYSNVTAGTVAFDLTLLSTNSKILEAFMKAEIVTDTVKLGNIEGDWKVTGMGLDIPNTTKFFAIVDGNMTSILIFPKAEITASLLGNPGATGALQLKLNAKAVTHDYTVPGTKKHLCYIANLETA